MKHCKLSCLSSGRDATFKRTYAALVLILAYLLPVVFLTKNYIHVIVYVVKMTDTRKQRQKRHQKCQSSAHCSWGTCRSDSRFPQLVV